MSEMSGAEYGEGLADPECLRQLVMSPDSGREAPAEEIDEFVAELRILMAVVDRLAERSKIHLEINAEFAAGPEPVAGNRLGFNYSIQSGSKEI